MNMIGLVFLLLLFIAFLLIAVLIGVYVYRDAKNREMNAPLWTLIALLAPSLIGFIIYLLVRGSHARLLCPACSAKVTETYTVCPNCGAKLKPNCPNCKSAADPSWKVCPYCTQPLPESQEDCLQPVQPKDRVLGKILVAVILIPVLLVLGSATAVIGLRARLTSSTTSYTTLSVGNYLSEMEDSQVQEWFEQSGKELNTAYVLRYAEPGNPHRRTCYVVYLPAVGEDYLSAGAGVSNGLFGNALEIHFDAGNEAGNLLFCAEVSSDKELGLKVYLNGKKVPVEITDVSFCPFPEGVDSSIR